MTLPSAKRLRCPQVTFSEMERASSWARELMMVMRSSPLASKVQMPSFSKKTSTPLSLRVRTVVSESTVLRANRDTLLVMIRSILPSSASVTICWNPARCLVEVPVMPSSV